MKTTNYLNALLISLGLSLIANTGAAQELLSVNTRLEGGYGITEFSTNDWVKVSPNNRLRLVVKSNNTAVANLRPRLMKQVGPNQFLQIGSADEVLFFASGMSKSQEFILEEGSSYSLNFTGNIVATRVLFGQVQKEPFTVSVRLENQDGRTILDFGDITVQYKDNIQKPIQNNAAAYEIVEGIINPSATVMHGNLYLQVEKK